MDAVPTRPLARLLAFLLLAGGMLAVLAAPATAAPCRPAGDTPERQTMRADAVFTGAVADRTRSGSTVTYDVDVDRIYKGRDVAAEVSVETPAQRCALPRLAEGDEVVWFVQADGERVTAASGDGTAPATAGRVQRLEDILGAGSPAIPPEPAEASFTVVADEPADATRHAAPGLALVLVGLLGLLLVAGLGRRRA